MKKAIICFWFVAATLLLAAGTTDKIRLRDGSEHEGQISNADARGFNLRGKYGNVRYDWTQVDLVWLRKANPELFDFIVQKNREDAALDQIVNDQQILQFISGKFVFHDNPVERVKLNSYLKSIGTSGSTVTVFGDVVQEPLLKNYNKLLKELNAALSIKQPYKRDQQLHTLIDNAENREILHAIKNKCLALRKVTRSNAIMSLILNYQRAIDSLLQNDFAGFMSSYKFVQEVLTQMGY